jgi:hypothetical protein
MKFLKRLSIKTINEEVCRTFRRFPLPVFFSILTTVLLIIEVENFSFFNNSPLLVKSIFISILGFSFTLVSTLHIEKSENKDRINFLAQLIVLTLLAYLFMTLPSRFRETDYITFATFLAASFFALMFVYTRSENDESYFGVYNITLFMRGFISFVFSVILFAGLASSLFAVQQLFFAGSFHEELYGDFWIVIISFFAPLHFMSGLPDREKSVTEDFSYPKPLKILLQYILIPLVSLYLIILYSYTVKIILTQIWPEGIVSYLILSYSLVGIVAVILLSPLKNDELFKWINTFSKYFFRALLPLIIVLFMAVMERISQYGITEKRYFILVLSLWLAGITLYMVFSKIKNLKLLPVTLSLLSVLSLFGPWSCFSVSKYSQLSILEDLLVKNKILEGTEIKKTTEEIPFEDRKSISSIISYFYDNHGIDKVKFLKSAYQKLAAENRSEKDQAQEYNFYRDTDQPVTRKMLVKEGIGFDFVDDWQNENTSNFLNMAVKYFHAPVLEDISAYDRFIDCRDNAVKDSIYDRNSDLYLKYDEKNFIVIFEKTGNDTVSAIDLKIPLQKIIADNINLNPSNDIDPEAMKVTGETDRISYMLLFRNFSAERKNDKEPYKIKSAFFSLYYKVKSNGDADAFKSR